MKNETTITCNPIPIDFIQNRAYNLSRPRLAFRLPLIITCHGLTTVVSGQTKTVSWITSICFAAFSHSISNCPVCLLYVTIPLDVHQRKFGLWQDWKKNEPETIAKITKNKPKNFFITNQILVKPKQDHKRSESHRGTPAGHTRQRSWRTPARTSFFCPRTW